MELVDGARQRRRVGLVERRRIERRRVVDQYVDRAEPFADTRSEAAKTSAPAPRSRTRRAVSRASASEERW
jgi:hypothetical protein